MLIQIFRSCDSIQEAIIISLFVVIITLITLTVHEVSHVAPRLFEVPRIYRNGLRPAETEKQH